MPTPKNALVVQGGSLRSIFTSGILDAFIEADFYPFDAIYCVSGGSMCASYYLTGQKGDTHKILKEISQDYEFINFRNFFSKEGYLNLEYLEKYSQLHYPLDIEKGMKLIQNKIFEIVATNLDNGDPVYMRPNAKSWLKCLHASSTLPFVTRGRTKIDNLHLMDGGWSDPIPVKRAIEHGSTNLVIIRTYPKAHRLDWSYMGWFAGWYHKSNAELAKRFSEDHIFYNDLCDYLKKPPEGITWHQIAPNKYLKTGNYSATLETLEADYKTGLRQGRAFLKKFGDLYR